jgi:ABC-type phosphate/phosphonate transport system substrate-binding protein
LTLVLTAPVAAAADFVFSITEGITYYQTNKEIQAKFAPLADLLSKALKRPVRMVIVSAYNEVREGLDRQEYDLSFIHPAGGTGRDQGGYRSVADDWLHRLFGHAAREQGPAVRQTHDLRGRTIVSPDPDSITAWMLRAMLRDQNSSPQTI